MRELQNCEIDYISGGTTATFLGGVVGGLLGAAVGSIGAVIAFQCCNGSKDWVMKAGGLSCILGMALGMGAGEIIQEWH